MMSNSALTFFLRNMAALRAGTAQLAEDDGTLRPIHGGDWIHLWYDGEYDSSNMLKGLLKNQLIVKVASFLHLDIEPHDALYHL